MPDSSRLARPRAAFTTALRVAVVTLLLGALAMAGMSAPANAFTSTQKGASRFGACLASQKEGDLLLLLDESSSLQQTDPTAARVAAAGSLFKTLGKYADRVGANLDFAVAGFAEQYVPERDWAKLTEASADASANGLADLSTKNTGQDTDYWVALDGARQALAARGPGANGAQRCQAIAWFSDGKIDFTPRALSKPYANGISLDAPNGVPDTVARAVESICRSGGLADQIRSNGIVMLGIGLGAAQTPKDFDVMSAIATGTGLEGMKCGDVTDPVPGDFYPVSNIDDMLFGFDALNPDPGVVLQGTVCQLAVCPEARHNFVLDRSIKSVNILGSGGVPGVVPYLISPSGDRVELPNNPGKNDVSVSGVPVTYEWQSESAQNIGMKNTAGSPLWAGQWAIVYVDTTGQHPDAVSKVSIHITTDIYPAVADPAFEWHGGQVLKNVAFGLVDEKKDPIAPSALAGTATLTATLEPDGAPPIQILDQVPKDQIATPVEVDLTTLSPGRALLRMQLVVTTAPATDPQGALIAAGTQLSPQEVTVPVQILPKAGLPVPGAQIDFGEGEAKKGLSTGLEIAGPGCAWVSEDPTLGPRPEGIGTTRVTSTANSPDTCVEVQKGATGTLPLELRTDENDRGGLTGTVPVHLSALDDPANSQVAKVPFKASLTKPLDPLSFTVALIAALILGPGIPLALLYASKWWSSRIPASPLLAERIPVQVDSDQVLRNGEPFAMDDRDLVQPVVGLSEATRKLRVHGVLLSTALGRSPFGLGRVVVDADGLVSVSSEVPGTDKSGLRGILPLAVHNKWIVLHDPGGPASHADVLLLVAGSTDVATRERLYEDVARRLPGLLSGLRARAVQEGRASPYDDDGAGAASPFGAAPAAGPAGYDPFGGDPMAAPPSYGGSPSPSPFGGGPSQAPGPRPPSPYGGNPGPPPAPYGVGQPPRAPYGGPPGSGPGAPPPPGPRPPSDPFDPFGEES